MYVGKNNLQNDALTFDFAAGCDWWFHAKQAPGSHVIVKTNGEELPDRTFEEAGKLAAYYSSMRGSGKSRNRLYRGKNILKKPKGAKTRFCCLLYKLLSRHRQRYKRHPKKYPAVRISKGVSILSARLFTVKTSQGVKHAEKHRYMSDALLSFLILSHKIINKLLCRPSRQTSMRQFPFICFQKQIFFRHFYFNFSAQAYEQSDEILSYRASQSKSSRQTLRQAITFPEPYHLYEALHLCLLYPETSHGSGDVC